MVNLLRSLKKRVYLLVKRKKEELACIHPMQIGVTRCAKDPAAMEISISSCKAPEVLAQLLDTGLSLTV
jgi:hypothetical protein